MTHTFNVTGMTCGGCKASVEVKLLKLSEVISASANIEESKVEVEMKVNLRVSDLQKVLPKKYQISEIEEKNTFNITQTEKSELKQLFPLFLIFGYIIIASFFMNYKSGNSSGFMLDFMSLFYIVFSFFKFLDYKGFPKSFRMYDPLVKVIPAYAWIYPFLELALGLAFLNRFQIEISLVITIIILGITTIGVAKALLNKSKVQCACLGTVMQLPMTKATFIENSIMIVIAVIMLTKIYVK